MKFTSPFACHCRSSLAILLRVALGTATIALCNSVRAEDPKPPDFSNDPVVKELLRQAAIQEAENKLAAAKTSELDVLNQYATLQADMATAEATVAEKNKAADEAVYGSRLSPLPGTVTTNSTAEAMVIVNDQMNQIALQIAKDMVGLNIARGAQVTLIPGDAGTSLQAGMRAYEQVVSELALAAQALTEPPKKVEPKKAEAEKKAVDPNKPPEPVVPQPDTTQPNPTQPDKTPMAEKSPLAAVEGVVQDELAKSDVTGSMKSFGLDGAASAIQAGLSFAALARVNRAYSGVEVKVDDMALISALAGHLTTPRLKVTRTITESSKTPVESVGQTVTEMRANPFDRVYSIGLIGGSEELVKRINELAGVVARAKSALSELDAREKEYSGKVTAAEKAVAEMEKHYATLNEKYLILDATVTYYERIVNGGGTPGGPPEPEEEKPAGEKPEEGKAEVKQENPALELEKAKRLRDDAKTPWDEARTERDNAKKKLEKAQVDLGTFQGEYKKAKAKVVTPLAKAEEYLKAIAAGSIGGVKLEDLMKAGAIKSRLGKFTPEGKWENLRGRYLAFVHVNSTAGTNLARQTLLTNSFRVAGGASVSFHLIRHDFSTVTARTYYDYDGFYRVKDRVVGTLPGNLPQDEGLQAEPEPPQRRKPMGHPGH